MSITAANAIIMMSVPLLFPVPQQIQGFAPDDVIDVEPQEVSETSMGVDGIFTAGFVFVPVKWNINLQADSTSVSFFDAWQAASIAAKAPRFV